MYAANPKNYAFNSRNTHQNIYIKVKTNSLIMFVVGKLHIVKKNFIKVIKFLQNTILVKIKQRRL